MDLRLQLSILRNWLGVLVASVVLALVAAYLVSGILPRVYEGKAILIVGQSLTAVNPDYNQILTSQRLSETYAEVATTRPVLDRVIQRLGLSLTALELAAQVKVEAMPNQELLTIRAQDGDPKRAADIANTLADELIAASPALQGRQTALYAFVDQDLRASQRQIEDVQAEVDGLVAQGTRTTAEDNRLETLQSRLITLRSTYATLLAFASSSSPGLLSVVEPALADPAPISPRPLFNTAIAGVLGLLVAIAVAFTVEHLDDTLKKVEDVEAVTGFPTLGMIGQIRGGATRRHMYRLVTILYPRSPIAEAFRTLRTNIEFTSLDAPIRTLLVTSCVPGEGKTTVACNVAVVFAQSGRRTILVDADLRRPGVHDLFDLPNSFGVTNLLRSDEVTVEAAMHETEVPNLRVLTTGPLPPNPAELLSSQRMKELIERLTAAADIVVFDSPPVQAVTDAAVLAARLDGTILVIRASRTRRANIQQGRDALARVNAKVLGVVLNQIAERAGVLHYQSYYRATDAPQEGAPTAAPQRAADLPGSRSLHAWEGTADPRKDHA